MDDPVSPNTSTVSGKTWCGIPTPMCRSPSAVIDAEEINAFALPGGFFFVNTGVLLNADTEAEMAGVMAQRTYHRRSAARYWQGPAAVSSTMPAFL